MQHEEVNSNRLETVRRKILRHLKVIYKYVEPEVDLIQLTEDLVVESGLDKELYSPKPHTNYWDQKDVTLICYGDSLLQVSENPLDTLLDFLDDYTKDTISGVHILPFFPYSSDDGFAITDFYRVNERLGDWQNIRKISEKYRLMADLVINHASSESDWFQNFKKCEGEGYDYFFCAEPDSAINKVVRPRTSPLLQKIKTKKETRHVWCTFSHDQVDFDFRNPKVLIEFVKIIRFYLDQGIRTFRLDAVAFLWKKLGTDCLNLPETHEVIRLLRILIEHSFPDVILITETNIPNRENLSYFGNANEAHCVYNFSLPPLLLNTLITGNCKYLKQWLMSMPPAQNGTAYFNFIASHDGIGLRPAEGLLSEEEIASLINSMQTFGGMISWRTTDTGIKKPYEINISLFDALQGTHKGKDELGTERFICAHAIMLALEGIPGIYIHSLLATGNDLEKVEKTGRNRSINRKQWNYDELKQQLRDKTSQHAIVYNKLMEIIKKRINQPAFHPNATQFTLHLKEQLFGFWRQSVDRRQSIFCVYNISDSEQILWLSDINLITTEQWYDLISGIRFKENEEKISLKPYQVLWVTNR